jgi:hypothetical protein
MVLVESDLEREIELRRSVLRRVGWERTWRLIAMAGWWATMLALMS